MQMDRNTSTEGKDTIIYQLANLPISRKIFFLHLPFTFDIGTI